MTNARRGLLALLAAVGAAGAVVEACGSNSAAPIVDASDAESDAGTDALDETTCTHARPPARPAHDDDAGAPDLEIYNAVRMIAFGDAGAPEGFDLDDQCTCPAPSSCNEGDAGMQCDLAHGIDNSFVGLVAELSGSGNFFDEGSMNTSLASGSIGIIVRVKGYNGQANDTEVEVDVFSSRGTENGAIPKWDGTDVWTLDPVSLLGGVIQGEPMPQVSYDLNAYVSNYTLVANISDLQLVFSVGGSAVAVSLNAAIVTAHLDPVGNSFQGSLGLIAGRWESKKLLTSLQTLPDPFDADASLCGSDAIYQLIKLRACAMQDLATNAIDDDAGAPCDALSFAFGFASVPATYGSAVAFDGGGGCGPTWGDNCP